MYKEKVYNLIVYLEKYLHVVHKYLIGRVYRNNNSVYQQRKKYITPFNGRKTGINVKPAKYYVGGGKWQEGQPRRMSEGCVSGPRGPS